MASPQQQDDMLFKRDTLRLYSSVRAAHTWLAERYGNNYDVVISTDPGPSSQFTSPHDREWWTTRRQELSLALGSINRCAFSKHSMLKMQRELVALTNRAYDELGPRAELPRRLRWSALLIGAFLDIRTEKFLKEKVRDPGLGARFAEVARRVGEMDPSRLSSTPPREAQYIQFELANVFDAFFGRNKAKDEVVSAESDANPFGAIFLGALVDNVKAIADQIAQAESGTTAAATARQQRKMLQWSEAYLHVIWDGVDEGLVQANAAEFETVRGLLDLTAHIAHTKNEDTHKKTWLIQELQRRLTALRLAFFAAHSSWASGRFEGHLAEIRRPPPPPLE